MTIPLPPVYNPIIPENQSSSIGKDQLNFLNNFAELYAAFAINHSPLDAASGQGNHTIVELLEQDPNNQFPANANEIAIYTREVAGQADQIFLRYQGNQKEFQYSAYQLYALTPTATQTPYFTFLPGRLIVYFGIVNTGGARTSTLSLFPFIAKNIVGMNFCTLGQNGFVYYPPNVTLLAPGTNGIFQTINLITSVRGFVLPNQLFYMVIANV